MRRKDKRKDSSGLTILEVVIASGLMLVIGTMLVLIMTFGMGQLTRAKALSIAQSLASQKMEEATAKAPNKLTPVTGSFPPPNDKYNYLIEYTPHLTYSTLQNAIVNVLGPFGVNTVYAQALPSSSFPKIIVTGELIVWFSDSSTFYVARKGFDNDPVAKFKFKLPPGVTASKIVGVSDTDAITAKSVVIAFFNSSAPSTYICEIAMSGGGGDKLRLSYRGYIENYIKPSPGSYTLPTDMNGESLCSSPSP